MKRIFLDTNILVDLIADRKPYSKFAIQIFEISESKKIKLYTSSHAFATTYYLLKKYVAEKQLRKILFDLLDFVQIISVNQETIKKSLKSIHKDFEDAIQINAACSIENMDGIVTRNPKDFKLSEVDVFTPEDLVRQIQ
ncbi:MAG: hypothetical protein RJA25_1400 [Bacteroidota bacterium]|jgi:predicted nucleic acid-binding protein